MRRPPLVDPIGPFPPRLVYAAIILLDLLVFLLILTLILGSIDWIEDLIFPGGREWLPF